MTNFMMRKVYNTLFKQAGAELFQAQVKLDVIV